MKFLVLLITVASLLAQNYSWNGFSIDIEHFNSRRDSSTMFVDGKAVGSWIWDLKRLGKTLNIKDKSVLFGTVDESIDAIVSLENTDEAEIALKLNTQRTALDAKIKLSSNNVSAVYNVNQREVKIDSTHENLRARLTALALLPFLKLDDRKHYLSLFSATSGSIFKASLQAFKNECLIIDEIEYAVTKVELFNTEKGKGIANTIYISNEKIRRILQVDVPSQKMLIQFTKELNEN